MIEITDASSRYIYRISKANPLIIERKLNRPRERWAWFRLCQTAEEARAVLLKLGTRDAKLPN